MFVKCRASAKGFLQVKLVHYYDMFAVVASGTYVQTVLSLDSGNITKIKGIDIITAFLYPELKEELYVENPEDIANYPSGLSDCFEASTEQNKQHTTGGWSSPWHDKTSDLNQQ